MLIAGNVILCFLHPTQDENALSIFQDRERVSTADMSLCLQKSLQVATQTTVQGRLSNDREHLRERANTRECKSAEERSAKVDDIHLGRLPPGPAARTEGGGVCGGALSIIRGCRDQLVYTAKTV